MTLRPKGRSPIQSPSEAQRATRALLEQSRNPPLPPEPPIVAPPPKRWCWLPAPQIFNLNAACCLINQAFGNGYGVYLVGSCLTKRDYRDVDIRLILSDDDFEKRYPGAAGRPDLNAAWALECASISCWLNKQTGLPIDFQIQSQKLANEQFSTKLGHMRHHLGMFLAPNPRDYAAHPE
jgi:hypothetical protein